MNSNIILYLALVLSSGLYGCSTAKQTVDQRTPTQGSMKPLAGLDDFATNSFHRISIADVHGVRLEVEQPSIDRNEIQIRVRDYAALNWTKKNISCDLYYISDNGQEAKDKFMSVTLKPRSAGSSEYLGGASNRVEFEHGNKFKVVYKSNGLPLPISTWYACYYH